MHPVRLPRADVAGWGGAHLRALPGLAQSGIRLGYERLTG
jgi:hypothetical protein